MATTQDLLSAILALQGEGEERDTSKYRYVIYARKSTDSEERQIKSIGDQIAELKEFATIQKIEIVASFTEAKTAKKPGRIAFNQMIERS